MGEHDEDRAVSRREAIKLSAKAAGVAAFASPVVVGAFSAPALGQQSATCDPATDSDAVRITSASNEKWNINCQIDTVSPHGRYNSQRSEFADTEIGNVDIVFGWLGTDNFPTHKSWYVIEAPAGYECSATWAISLGGPDTTGQGCTPATQFVSTPPPTIGPGETQSLENSAPGAQPLPYCTWSGVGSDKCNNQFLELVTLDCCFRP